MKKNLPAGYNGITLEQWRTDPSHLRWSQSDPMFRQLLAVVVNEAHVALAPLPGVTENRILGRAEGYQMALEVLRSTSMKPFKPEIVGEPTYPQPDESTEVRSV